jgi:hypothetical protein
MANKWLVHVKKTMKLMKKTGAYKKGDGLKKVILAAKKTYQKTGGGDEEPEPRVSEPSAPVGVKHMEDDPKQPGGRRFGRGRRSTKRRARK